MNHKFDKRSKGSGQSLVRKNPLVLPVLVAGLGLLLRRRKAFLFGWLLLATPVAVQAQFTYATNNSTITITGYTGTDSAMVVPDTITGLPVTAIGEGAFHDLPWGLASITISESVTNIADDAFVLCCDLNGNPSLTYITVDPLNPAYSSADGVLFNKNQTTLIQCPQGTSLTSVTIPSTVTNIGVSAFYLCSSLTSVTIPNSVTNIGDWAFSGCISLTNVTIPNSVTNIGDWAFAYCTSLTSVTIPSTVTNIGVSAFYLCSSLTSVTIPNSVTNIGDWAFAGCTRLTKVTIPNSVTSIGDEAFYACTSLTSVPIGESVTSIGDWAIYGCTSLTNVTIPNSVISIGYGAFAGCTSLINVTIPNSITSIGDEVFAGTSLTGVTIPNSVTSIGAGAFSGCSSLTNVTIPSSVTDIGGINTFAWCHSLTRVYFQGNAPDGDESGIFDSDANAIAYYLPGTTGWSTDYGGIPTALWTLPYPIVLTSTHSFDVRTNQFGFTVSWATNLSVVVEAATDLANPIWSPLATNALSGGTFYFAAPQWTNYPSRFYRVRSQ